MTVNRIRRIISTVVLWALSLLVLVPLYMVVINSFKSKTDAAQMNLSFPAQWHVLSNYVQMINDGGVWTGFKNSIVITVVCVAVIILLSSMAAFVLVRRKSRLTGVFSNVFLLGIILPVQIIPTVFFCNALHLSSFLSAIFVLIVANFSIAIFLYTGFIRSVPGELDESALMDGAGTLRLFFQIIFPLLKPVTVTVIIVSFMSIWNDFGNVIYFLNDSSNYTITLTIYNFFGQHNSDWQLVFANVVFASIPVVVVYLLLQRYIISGMTAGAVKG